MNIRFSETQVGQFSSISLDRNPIHLSPEYARKTPFGRPVVFGVLGVIEALAVLPIRPRSQVKQISINFYSPMFADLDYSVRLVEGTESKSKIELLDGRRTVLSIILDFLTGDPAPVLSGSEPRSTRETPRVVSLPSRSPALEVSGYYQPDLLKTLAISRELGLGQRGVSLSNVVALMWSGYLVGMEIPGSNGLFGSLTLSFGAATTGLGAWSYRANLLDFDSRFQRAKITADFRIADLHAVTASITAYTFEETAAILSANQNGLDLKGRVGLVLGASRGLGSALLGSLALAGGSTYGLFRESRDSAEKLKGVLTEGNRTVELIQGDSSDQKCVEEVLSGILAKHGRLDFLFCCASPPRLPLWIESATLGRISQYVNESLLATTVPLACAIPHLVASSGSAVLISTSQKLEQHPELAHFFAAKASAEALFAGAARQNEGLRVIIARAPKMATDLTNTPLGRMGAVNYRDVASRVLTTASDPRVAPLTFIDEFPN